MATGGVSPLGRHTAAVFIRPNKTPQHVSEAAGWHITAGGSGTLKGEVNFGFNPLQSTTHPIKWDRPRRLLSEGPVCPEALDNLITTPSLPEQLAPLISKRGHREGHRSPPNPTQRTQPDQGDYWQPSGSSLRETVHSNKSLWALSSLLSQSCHICSLVSITCLANCAVGTDVVSHHI